MGGYGSTRWSGYAPRPLIGEETLPLSARQCAELVKRRKSAPDPDRPGLAWRKLAIGWRANATVESSPVSSPWGVEEWFLTIRPEDGGSGTVRLRGEHGGFGGIRYYLICPGCTHRREKLYTMEREHPRLWRCRNCRGLAYASQRLQRSHRLQNRAQKIEIKLGGLWPLDDQGKPWQGIPPRPPRMHWATYDRLVAELLDVEDRELAAMMNELPVWLHRATAKGASDAKQFSTAFPK